MSKVNKSGPKGQAQPKKNAAVLTNKPSNKRAAQNLRSVAPRIFSGFDRCGTLISSTTQLPLKPVTTSNLSSHLVIPVNPGQVQWFPRLYHEAVCFNKYRFRKITIDTTRMVSEMATAGQSGQINIAYNADPLDAITLDVVEIQNLPHSTFLTSESGRLTLTQRELGSDWRFTRFTGVSSVSTLRDFDNGHISISAYGSTAGGVAIATVTITYEVEFCDPMLPIDPSDTTPGENIPGSFQYHFMAPNSSSAVHASAPVEVLMNDSALYPTANSCWFSNKTDISTQDFLLPNSGMQTVCSSPSYNASAIFQNPFANLTGGVYHLTGSLAVHATSGSDYPIRINAVALIGGLMRSIGSYLLPTGVVDGPNIVHLPIDFNLFVDQTATQTAAPLNFAISCETYNAGTWFVGGPNNSYGRGSSLRLERLIGF